ncbi:MAG: hypothetical protein HW406_2208 [Candidatus Brocadiaceae bacterium]|nr:hypothetical protein [Candidatus Brocadiaceae bacterium]
MLLNDFRNYNNNQYESIRKYEKQIKKDEIVKNEILEM